MCACHTARPAYQSNNFSLRDGLSLGDQKLAAMSIQGSASIPMINFNMPAIARVGFDRFGHDSALYRINGRSFGVRDIYPRVKCARLTGYGVNPVSKFRGDRRPPAASDKRGAPSLFPHAGGKVIL